MRLIIVLFISFLCYCYIPSALAGSKAATYLVKQEIAKGCDGKKGTIEKSAIIERDLTGDGRKDLIINHAGISCAGGGMSGYCGVQLCSFNIYIRRGKLLKFQIEKLGMGLHVTTGKIPTIHWYAHDGSAQKFRWDGKRFR
jgi:hypothetical protein